ncbi:MAG: tRNA threonylcarbamoyladenosine dehydratase [Bacteroidales bacterium]|nr:tRNA threonylcarbamoyladenosine dehydratase [Bacteroidales bacterium]MDD4670219.1 tRNA threonylcarbamoyladenosine dehydratase [Bacteroidales bacterium]
MTSEDISNWKERTLLMLGEERLHLLENSTVAVIGLGGVGAYAAEMVVRAGVGSIIILDSDLVTMSNKNRQLLALNSNIGKKKTDVMEARLRDINPDLNIVSITEYLTEENISDALGVYKIDYLIDAIDTLSPKIALICYCVDLGIPHVSSMGAGAKLDATKIRLTDISKSFNCPLAFILRKKLRKKGISKGFKVVFSEELPDRETIIPVEEQNKKSQVGTISYLPAVFGCICAQSAIDFLIGND